MLEQLSLLANEDIERVGIVLDSGVIVEFKNLSEDPEDSFLIDVKELIPYIDELCATWHTHAWEDVEASEEEHFSLFHCWPDIDHYIIGSTGYVRRYYVQNKRIRFEDMIIGSCDG